MESNEINDVAPTSLGHIIGQKSVVAQVAVAVEAAFADGKKFDSALLIGPPGTGKSAVARVIADEMAAQSARSPGAVGRLARRPQRPAARRQGPGRDPH